MKGPHSLIGRTPGWLQEQERQTQDAEQTVATLVLIHDGSLFVVQL